MDAGGGARTCCLHINHPDHVFDKGLKAEAERVAGELTRSGFPIRVELRYGRGDESSQLQQIEADRHAVPRPGLFIVIPINKDAVYTILSEIVKAHEDVTCVFLHQPLTRIHSSERQIYGSRLFSVAADQAEIGRIQARQFAALVPGGAGDVLYVQGRATSFATAERMKGLLAELPQTRGVKLTGYRVYGDWSPESVRPAVEGWMQLGGRLEWIQAAGAQNDDMAMALSALLRERARSIPVIGVDGLETGRRAVDEGVLAATVVQPLGVGQALRTYRDLLGVKPDPGLIPEDGNIVLGPESYPSLSELVTRRPPAPR
jgi:ABC-type sugar transport system substrate-binding protein